MSLAAAAGGLLLVLAAALVHRDATRVGVEFGSPALWTGLVLLAGGTGAVTALLVPDAPIPGVLVVVALGPLLYLLERDDSLHGDDDADPTRLPSATRGVSNSSDEEATREETDDDERTR
ncbi:hypothetical protein SAMN04488066_11013 [Halorubrum aquaticum]|uniref:Uncharacterized protein n=1 Tax=Halorubrum aquaticum TaxID=387340 RepID=A0A1I3B6K3_9EURY|nr:hypothetical protein [Halorubrum aquaticum]SFH57914.1 hypothetical protein SAMN04488066_11013 [Halorubrum aquaticum]